MTNPFVTLGNKFACDLEEILQCTVCFETLSKTVPVCIQGHHVCVNCRAKMMNCPFCKSNFTGTRNYLAENLLTKFDEIKSSLINPKQPTNNVVMVCQETQTDFVGLDNDTKSCTLLIRADVNDIAKKNPVAAGKGTFPCKFENCKEELAHGRMIPHIRYYHNDNLIEEKLINTDKYTLEWEHSRSTKNFERIISIPNMGLFFLHMVFNDTGDLEGNVQIINNATIAKQFNYSLLLSNVNTSISYRGQVMSCRTTPEKVKTKSLFVNNLSVSQLMGEKQTINCILLLQRVIDDLELKSKK